MVDCQVMSCKLKLEMGGLLLLVDERESRNVIVLLQSCLQDCEQST